MPSDTLGPWDVVVTAGGTGGHVLPALAVVDGLEGLGVARERIGFLGGTRGIEVSAVPAAGVTFRGLDVRGLRRGLSVRAVLANLTALWAMAAAVIAARRILCRARARVVVAMGGYASVPAVVAARRRRQQVVVYESNSVPGVATRLAARRAALTTCAMTATASRLPDAVTVGFMVRSPLERFASEPSLVATLAVEARSVYGIEAGRQVVVVMGGSQGARSLNDATVELVQRWRERDDLAVLHLVGRRDLDTVLERAARLGSAAITYVPIGFEDRMDRVYAVCDLMVCRSGASTCAELAATGTAAVCVPYPHATADHQRLNAAALVEAGAAEMLADDDVDADTLGNRLNLLLGDPDRLAAMRAAAAALGASNGARELAARVVGLLEEAG